MPSQRSQEQVGVPVESLIISLRGERAILDSDLARIYGVKTGDLNRAVKRNLERFPKDFLFQLTAGEVTALRCQSGISKRETRSGLVQVGRGGRRYLPYAFTEHGALMAANVLNSPRAVLMSVSVVRAFVRMRTALADTRELARKLADLERKIAGHDESIQTLFEAIRQLMAPPERPRRSIGFRVEEGRPGYGKPRRVRTRGAR